MKSVIIKFGMLSIALLMLINISHYSLMMRNMQDEITITAIAIVFILVGFFLRHVITVKKHKNLKVGSYNAQLVKKLGISSRELEILNKMAEGNSNREIAEQLFIAESTVKTHVSNVLLKLDARRRTEAIRKARQKKLITDFSTT